MATTTTKEEAKSAKTAATAIDSHTTPPWHAAYPPPKNSNPESISRADLLQLLLLHYSSDVHENKKKKEEKDFVLIDLRRMDHEGGTIRGSINLPAQSLWDSIPSLYELFEGAGVERVIWYCGNKNSTSNGRTFIHNKDKTTGSSRGRGTRAAGWFDDYIQKQKNPHMKSLTLAEGIKGWSGAGKEYTDLMDGYEERVWREGKGEK